MPCHQLFIDSDLAPSSEFITLQVQYLAIKDKPEVKEQVRLPT